MNTIFSPIKLVNSISGCVISGVSKLKQTADNIRIASNSVIGKAVSSSLKLVAGETVGMMMGSSFPVCAIGARTAQYVYQRPRELYNDVRNGVKHLYRTVVDSSPKQKVVATTALVSFALIATTVGISTDLTQYVVEMMGTLAGGMVGLTIVGGEPSQTSKWHDGYCVRTSQYLVARTLFDGIRGVTPIPVGLGALTGVIGGVAKAVVGTLGYYAQPLIKVGVDYYNRDPNFVPPNCFDPGTFIRSVIQHSHGDVATFMQEMTTLFLGGDSWIAFLALFATGPTSFAIEQQVMTNEFVRAFNGYMTVLQMKEVKSAMQALATCSPEQREDEKQFLRRAIRQGIKAHFYFRKDEKWMTQLVRNRAVAPQITSLAKQLAGTIVAQEKELTGFPFSDPEILQEFLEVHLLSLGYTMQILLKRTVGPLSVTTRPLENFELQQFYANINQALLSQYHDVKPIRWLEKGLSAGLPLLVEHGAPISFMVAKKIGAALAPQTKEVKKSRARGLFWLGFIVRIKIHVLRFITWAKQLFSSDKGA